MTPVMDLLMTYLIVVQVNRGGGGGGWKGGQGRPALCSGSGDWLSHVV